MTILTDVRRVDMARIFSVYVDIVMTTETVSADAGVIENGRDPQRTVVAIVALVARDNMAGRLARRDRAVVAGAATTGYRRMIHVVNRAPGRCRVAAVTGFRGGDMAGRFHRREDGADL